MVSKFQICLARIHPERLPVEINRPLAIAAPGVASRQRVELVPWRRLSILIVNQRVRGLVQLALPDQLRHDHRNHERRSRPDITASLTALPEMIVNRQAASIESAHAPVNLTCVTVDVEALGHGQLLPSRPRGK